MNGNTNDTVMGKVYYKGKLIVAKGRLMTNNIEISRGEVNNDVVMFGNQDSIVVGCYRGWTFHVNKNTYYSENMVLTIVPDKTSLNYRIKHLLKPKKFPRTYSLIYSGISGRGMAIQGRRESKRCL